MKTPFKAQCKILAYNGFMENINPKIYSKIW